MVCHRIMMLSFKIFTTIQNVLTIVSIVASTVSLLFLNAYVQRCVYKIYIESKRQVTPPPHMYNSLNGGFFNGHCGFSHSHEFSLGYKIGYRVE
jgi:preprotein translocase subunit SecY